MTTSHQSKREVTTLPASETWLPRWNWNCAGRKLLFVLWLCFVLRGCFYAALLPAWEGYDEPFHFSFIQYVATHRTLPLATTPVSREVQASLHLLPLSWEQRLHRMDPPIYTQDNYWQLPESDRRELQQQVRSIPPEWFTQTGTAPAMYEAQQAPLYYWIMSIPLRLNWRWGLPAQLMLIRILGVLLASLLIPIAYVAAKRFFNSRAAAVGVVSVIVCMPELMIDVTRASNESLAVVVFSVLTLLLLMAVEPGGFRWFVAAGAVLGIGLLTKAYFVAGVPAFILIALYSIRKYEGERKRVAWNALLGLALAVLLSFGWYWRNHSLTGSWSGEENDVAAVRGGMAHLMPAALHVNWVGGVTSVLVSHIWFGGWSFLKLPKPIYLLFALGIAVVVAGLAKLLLKDRLRSSNLFVVFTLYGCFWIGLLYDILVVRMATGVSASDGWYMYAVILPELLLAAASLYSLLPQRMWWAILPSIAAAFAAIDLYGVCFLLIPYYAGIIRHTGDLVRPASLAQFANASPLFVLQRLTANRPEVVSPWLLAVLTVFYFAATLLPVVLGYVAGAGPQASMLSPSAPQG